MERISVVYPNLKRDVDGKLTECKLLPPEFKNLAGSKSDENPEPSNLPKLKPTTNSRLTL